MTWGKVTGKDDWKKFEKNNRGITLNALYVKKNSIYILPAFQNTTQVVLLMITNVDG